MRGGRQVRRLHKPAAARPPRKIPGDAHPGEPMEGRPWQDRRMLFPTMAPRSAPPSCAASRRLAHGPRLPRTM